MRLFAIRYNKEKTEILETLDDVANVGIRWQLPFGFTRLEFTIKVDSEQDAYDRYTTHHGQGLVLLDSFMDYPIADGWIYEVVPDNLHVTYVVAGVPRRMGRLFDTLGSYSPDTSTHTVLGDLLTDHLADVVSANRDNVDDMGTFLGASYDTGNTGGLSLDRIFSDLIRFGSSSDDLVDFWFESPALTNGLFPNKVVPYLKKRTATGDVDWQVDRRDLDGVSLSRHIWDLITSVRIDYILSSYLTVAAVATDTTITVDNVAGFSVNDEINIQLDDGTTHTTVITMKAGSVLTLTDAMPSAAALDNYVRRSEYSSSTGTNLGALDSYWEQNYHEVRADMDDVQAGQYRTALLDVFATPVQQSSFKIGSEFAMDSNGIKFPLWRMLIRGGYLRINDLFPDIGNFGTRQDGKNVFKISAMDYDHNSRIMTITPESPTARLDIVLQNTGIKIASIVERVDRQPPYSRE